MIVTQPHRTPTLHGHWLPLGPVPMFRAFRRDPLAFFERLAQNRLFQSLDDQPQGRCM